MNSLFARSAVMTAFLASGAGALAQDTGIRNFLWVDSDFCTAGQPTVEQLAGLRDQGVRSVLNLRPASEFDATVEETRVGQLGMRYYNIPVDGANVQDSQVEEFLRLSDDGANHPMFIHCASANRVGAFWLIRRVLRDGWDLPRAQAEAERVGLRAASLRDFALDYIRRHP